MSNSQNENLPEIVSSLKINLNWEHETKIILTGNTELTNSTLRVRTTSLPNEPNKVSIDFTTDNSLDMFYICLSERELKDLVSALTASYSLTRNPPTHN